MKRFFTSVMIVLALVFALGVLGGSMASADTICSNSGNPLACACGSGASSTDSTACSTDGTKNPIAGPDGILKKATLLLALLSGIAAVIIIIISGFRYVTAGGDAQKISSAQNGILGSVIGLVIIAVSTTIVVFVVSRL